MAFRASNALPAYNYDRAKKLAWQLRRLTSARSAEFASGATSAQVLSVLDNMRALKAELDEVKTTPGIAAYAKAQEDDVAYDVVAEFTAMLAAVDAVIQEIITTMPKDGSGFLLLNQFDVDGALIPRNFTAAQLANLRTLLDGVTSSVS
jgi:hypothetical protein